MTFFIPRSVAPATGYFQFLARDNNLPGRIKVRRFDIKITAQLGHLGAFLTDNRSHRTFGLLTRDLHEAAPFCHDFQPRLKIKNPRRRVGRDFAQTEAQRKIDRRPLALLAESRPQRQAVHK